ncbi:hypothetical protein GUJ93_ZPchr0012g21587 [Zizania palustris]|uniref:Uncharacterized protein n=1 Tax=Zizania palustris TaxID=103762 RepID=A0A8J5WPQ5_ZIZPA|nr:hypothetical protein GUJ93_ZPchr0012g21587 [Zizania palustris]
MIDERHYSRRMPRRQDEDDEDDDEYRDSHQPNRRRGHPVWTRIDCSDGTDVRLSASRRRSISYDSRSYHHRQADSKPMAKVPSAQAVNLVFDAEVQKINFSSHLPHSVSRLDPMWLEATHITATTIGTPLIPHAEGTEETTVEPVEEDSEALGVKLDDFLASLSMALPQALVPTPPKVRSTKSYQHAVGTSRRSARSAAKNPHGTKTASLALQVLVRKLGIVDHSSSNDAQKLATYFKQQLSPSAVRAIRELVEAGEGNPGAPTGLNGPFPDQSIS